MAIPVLFLESSSGHQNPVTQDVATGTALSLIKVLLTLRKINKAISINSPAHLSQIEIAPNTTLQSVLAGPAHTDQWLLIKTLASNSPLSHGLDDWLEQTKNCEAKTAKDDVSLALLFAVLCKTGTVSLGASPIWMKDWVTAKYSSLDANANLQTDFHDIRNLGHVGHAIGHQVWLTQLNNGNSAATIWRDRNVRFPGLRFVAGVERMLAELSVAGASYVQALDTLQILNEDSLRWAGDGEPTFSVKTAAGEHDQRRDLIAFFDDEKNTNRDFGRHAYFTGGIPGRIHFIADAVEKCLIIGYLGRKL